MYIVLKDQFTDAYVIHLKGDIDNCKKIKSDLKLVAGFPRRVSKENHAVSLSQGKTLLSISVNIHTAY
eukprot:scaffold19175_cov67-Attheya_sp.AAC.3